MDITKNYISCRGSDAAMILMLGSGGSTPLTKGVSKWLVGQGVSVLPLGPEEGVAGYHSFPLEMDSRLKSRPHNSEYDALVYQYGTHYAFPESMLKGIIPVFPDFLIGRAFLSAREHPDECKATREDIDRRMKQALSEWTKEKAK